VQAQNNYVTAQNSNPITIPPLGTVRVGYFWSLDTLVRNLGGNPFDILEKKGLDPRLFDDPDNTLECIAAVDLLAYCSTALGDPLFGLHLAALQEPDVFGCVVALAQAAPSFRQALQCLVDFIPVSASPECELELVVTDNVVELRWRSHIGLGHDIQTSYHGLLIILKTLRMLGRKQFQPRYASLTCPIQRADLDAISQQLGCRIQGNASHNAIAFSAASLDQALPTSNRLSYYILSQGMAQLRTTSRGDFEEKVRACVRRELSSGHCTVGSCSADLRTSTRTLQKRLHRMGIKFSDIVLSERIKLAKYALTWSDHSLDEIAFQLGYAEQTSFGRAFKTATGLTPKAFRSSRSRES
jgi:AraC-like DNA-binding protein